MSVAALMMVRDEADIIGHTLDWLNTQVDHIYLLDNRSVDGTRELAEQSGATVIDDPEVGYWQSAKMSRLAYRAWEEGHQWVIPVDADEIWVSPSEWKLGPYLAGHGPDVLLVKGQILNFLPTGLDPKKEENPLRRITWRIETPGVLPKVAARTSPTLTIHAGNHHADYGARKPWAVDGFQIRHYSWRTPEQYIRKIRNGLEAYAETNLPSGTGAHWRGFAGATDEELEAHFREWFWVEDPTARSDLVQDVWERNE